MAEDEGQNLRHAEVLLSGEDIAKLNEMNDGLGQRLLSTLSFLVKKGDAQAGHSGPVLVAKQKKLGDPGMKLQGQPISDVAPGEADDDVVTVKQLRSLLTCVNLTNILADCIDDMELPKDKPLCRPIGLSVPRDIATGLERHWGVAVQNSFVYVLGEASFVGHIKVYRRVSDNSFEAVGDLELSEIFQRMILQGQYLYLVRTDTASSNLCSVSINVPDIPDEVSSVGIGIPAKNVFAQGRWVYVAGAGGVKLVDISVPGFPVARGFAV